MSFLESWWDKFLSNPTRVSTVFAIVFLVQAIPLVQPLGFPMVYSYYTTDFFYLIDGGTMSYGVTVPGVQPGDIVVWGDMSEHAASWSSGRDMWATPVMFMVGERGGKIILANFGYSSISIFKDLISRYMNRFYPDLVYGEDFLITEYMPGREAAVKLFAENVGEIRDAINHRAINSYPAFAHVVDFNDVDYAWGTVIRTTDHDIFFRQFATDYPETNVIASSGYDVCGPYYGNIIKACWQYSFEMEKIIGSKYGGHFFGEQILRIEAQELGVLMYLPLLVWAFYVNWKRAISEGVSLRPRVGERGQ